MKKQRKSFFKGSGEWEAAWEPQWRLLDTKSRFRRVSWRERPTVFRGKGTHKRDFITVATATKPQTQGQLAGRQITLSWQRWQKKTSLRKKNKVKLLKKKISAEQKRRTEKHTNKEKQKEKKRKSACLSGVLAYPRLPPPGLPSPLSRDDDVFLGEYWGPAGAPEHYWVTRGSHKAYCTLTYSVTVSFCACSLISALYWHLIKKMCAYWSYLFFLLH